MKDKTTLRIESNTLIAKFMDVDVMSMSLEEFRKLPKIDKTFCNGTLAQDLTYDVDWNSLMTVVEKIEDFFLIGMEEIEFQVVSYEDEIKIVAKHLNKSWEVIVEVSADGSGKKSNTYKAVVQFIKWYNENK